MAKHDREGMVQAATDYPQQWQKACTMPLPDLSSLPRGPQQVLFTGMGGSGTGGEFAQYLLDQQGSTVGRVVHDYEIPGWVSKDTLIAATSYSGGTEETLSGLVRAVQQKAPWFAITTGGPLGEAAKAHDAPWVEVPTGLQPRAAFGYLTVFLLRSLASLGLLAEDRLMQSLERAGTRIEAIQKSCHPDVPLTKNLAKQLAQSLSRRPILVVADTPWAPVAERVRCQFNENGKALSFTRILPEANHNDTLAWSRASDVNDWSVLFLGPFDRLSPIKERADFLAEQLQGRGVPVHYLVDREEDPVARMFATSYIADWVSIYLGLTNGQDPGEIDVIKVMKDRVGKTGHMDFVRKQLGM